MSEQIYVKNLYWDSTEDVFNEGDVGTGRVVLSEENVGLYDSFKDMVNDLSRKFGITTDLERWIAFEDGRINVQMLIDNKNYEADKRQVALWKRGEMRLWNAYITISIKFVTPHTPSVSEMSRNFGIRSEE